MHLIIPKEDILKQLFLQLSSNFLVNKVDENIVTDYLDITLESCEYNFKRSDNKRFKSSGGNFNPYHTVQYMIFLYYLSHNIYIGTKNIMVCDKLYYLNKILNGVDLFYQIELPKVFGAEHPIGSVMGRAKYGNNFFFYQGCTVGGTHDKKMEVIHYPIIEDNVRMFSNASILGRSHIGCNVDVGAGCIIKNQDVPSDSIVFGESPDLIIKSK